MPETVDQPYTAVRTTGTKATSHDASAPFNGRVAALGVLRVEEGRGGRCRWHAWRMYEKGLGTRLAVLAAILYLNEDPAGVLRPPRPPGLSRTFSRPFIRTPQEATPTCFTVVVVSPVRGQLQQFPAVLSNCRELARRSFNSCHARSAGILASQAMARSGSSPLPDAVQAMRWRRAAISGPLTRLGDPTCPRPPRND